MNCYKVHIKSVVEKDPSGFKNVTHDINSIKYHCINNNELLGLMDIKDIGLEDRIRKIIKKMLLREHLINEILK